MRKVIFMSILLITLFSLTACSMEKPTATSQQAVDKSENIKQTVDSFGVIKSRSIRNLTIDFPAWVEKVHVKDNQRIKKGDPLISLSFMEFESQIKNKELKLSTEKNELATKLSKPDPDRSKLNNDLETAESEYSKVMSELSSYEKLYNSGSISQHEVDEYKKTVNSKKKAVEDIKYSISSKDVIRSSEVNQKSANASILETEIKVMKDKLSKSYLKGNTIIAEEPYSLVYSINCFQGDAVGLNSNPQALLRLMDVKNVYIKADIPEEFIRDVKTGAEVLIIPQADSAKQYKGKVLEILGAAIQENSETNIPVEISIDDIDDFLLPNMNVNVKINKAK